MIRAYQLSELAAELGGRLNGQNLSVSGISIDSRSVQSGELFIAIKGPNFDGHAYVDKAIESGAAAVLVQEQPVNPDSFSYILVDDTSEALGQLGAFNRHQTDIPFLAITGSCGKTSVKEMLAAILDQEGSTLATHGNLNNAFGVPLTLFSVEAGNQFAVIELGTSSPGEIGYISELTRPDVSVITNAAETHLDGLVDVAGVAQEKGFILDSLSPSGTAILNLDDDFFNDWQQRTLSGSEQRRVRSFSLNNSQADSYGSDIETTTEGMRFTLNLNGQKRTLRIAFWGQHQVQNACCAAVAASAAGIGLDKIVQGLENARPYQRRGQRFALDDRTLVIDETYNANPKATLAAVDQLAECEGHRIMVLGDMLDLGAVSQQRHHDVGAYARDRGIETFIALGDASRQAVSAYGRDGRHFETKASLVSGLRSLLSELDVPAVTVLVKGSRGMGMLDIVRSLVGSDYKGER
ncbi:hypothetical protein GZ77_16785 [Endozoicomonas montiporae]|uniref:UDP-N-acetylmuramoyl-tripeptide--D-alanyl-D-alanine ligase n=2 Tax=Endozoicomonas montiporae TaxID=1027273 RepID=A0A081N632_9GAMM|nr:UDP-N-acetylmuramoyl-tripeptide--D-alanyl-D-alanine ligase [Endozoicomonas montiporae]AMO57176.1 UDP-N-acetylmuramoyl-tripeptide--D-alanyl-D-alanine ligase [Endozoicomonas montiporae CL-33]KEQ13905.1 hypothetical protein GZ77_16785 [Endozoicomonas montiporae]